MKYLKTYELYGENLIKNAEKFATHAHSGVYRKGLDKDGEKIPYIIHPKTVAKIVQEVKDSEHIAYLIAAAYLHDVVQDVKTITRDDIFKEFGDLVASLVDELTSDLDKIAISGKEEYLIDKMLNMSSWALVIKLADRLHNLSDFKEIMAGNDKKRQKWVRKYAEQTKNIIDEVEWYRDLSGSQKKLVDKIRHKLKIVI
jgi:(p)ppGpp synthase/HD superfamily hydrolase